ncbi:hypothetical protein PRIPAC_84738 [Pristionchus pacificus]|uniref:Uncharacterized protein n=1 Tax=Pristionchus pacificus TaxID=54126 RepID=A0A2A6BTS6_PRIPA|nr:hypothetical protein PRIPAC_84738 [Pristionchus pacificus]|eukprot:PDM69216.1 hypothetical protein PRIPAC_47518 [Pristionchus pacificus]
MMRPMLLVAVYSAIIYNTWEMVTNEEYRFRIFNTYLEIHHLYYPIGVILSGWALFSIADALIDVMRKTFREMLKAVGMMIVAGLIIAPLFLFPVWGTTIAYSMFFLLVILPFLVMCVIAWGALGG